MERQKRRHTEMAHRIRMPDDFNRGLMADAIVAIDSKNRKEIILNYAILFWDLNTYMNTLEIDGQSVSDKRVSKGIERGGFSRGVLQIKPDGTSKLVREGIPSLPKRPEDPEYKYQPVDRKQLLSLLDLKLVEECEELIEETQMDKRVEELADIFEVIGTILKFRNIQMKEIDLSLQAIQTVPAIEGKLREKRLRN